MSDKCLSQIEEQWNTVKLSETHTALFDIEDYAIFSQGKWGVSNKGYLVRNVRINGKQTGLKFHRIVTNAPKGMEVDHINGNRLDNRKRNLRVCTKSQNQQNSRSYTGLSHYKGVTFHKDTNKWRANIKVDGKQKHLGLFPSETDAATAYNEAAVKYYGEYALINKVGD